MSDDTPPSRPAGRRRLPRRARRRAGPRRADRQPGAARARSGGPTDVDPKAEKRAERQVAALFGLSAICAVLFVVSYFAFDVNGGGGGEKVQTVFGLGASNVALGASLGLALLLIGIGLIQWARKLMGDHEIVEMRHPAALLRRGPRGDARGCSTSAPRSPASPGGR